MPSLLHAALVAMLRDHPEFTRSLLLSQGVEVPVQEPFRSSSEDQTQSKPAEFRADAVLLVGEPKPVLGIIAEVQLAIKARKRRSWPNYLTGLYAKHRCPCVLLVLAPSRRVARWAARPILVSPGWVLHPTVIGPEQVPIVTEPEVARRIPELAVLSAIVHGKGDPETAVQVVLTVREVISNLDERTQALYSDLSEIALGPVARKAFAKMNLENYQFRGVSYTQGKQEGLLEGKQEGLLEGKQEGLLEGKQEGLLEGERQLLLRQLRSKFGELRQSVEARVRAAAEPELFDWSERVLTATSLDEVFGS